MCPRVMTELFTWCEVIRCGGDFTYRGFTQKYEMEFPCPCGSIRFHLKANPINRDKTWAERTCLNFQKRQNTFIIYFCPGRVLISAGFIFAAMPYPIANSDGVMSRVAKDSYVLQERWALRRARELREVFFALFLFIAVHSTIEPPLSTIMIET